MTLRARDRLVKLLRKRGLRINDTITTALDSFLIEVREQQAARGADIEDDESEDDEDEDDDLEADDEDADEEEDDVDDEDGEEEQKEESEEADAGVLGGKAKWDAEVEGSEPASPKSKSKTAKSGKKQAKAPEPEEEEAPEEERTLVQEVTCPHCGERIPLVLDLSGGDQDDIQDCEVCCSPIRVTYTVRQGALGEFSIEAS